MAMITPVAQYALHDLTPEQMSPLSLSSTLPPKPQTRATLPSLHSLNLITPPHSVGQKREDSFHSTDQDPQSDCFDMRLMPDAKLSSQSSPPLFMEPNSHFVSGPPMSFEQVLAQYESPFEDLYGNGRVRRPTKTEYLETIGFTTHYPIAFKGWADREKRAQSEGERKPRRGFSIPRSAQKIKLEESRPHVPKGFRLKEPKAADQEPGHQWPLKKVRTIPTKTARISSTPVMIEQAVSEEPEYEMSPRRSAKNRGSTGSSSGIREPKHARNKSTKIKRSSDHKDYPDFAPSFDAMSNPLTDAEKVRALDVRNPIDLENDSLRDELHESELIVAKRLNVSAGVYLCTKRQIFEGYVKYLKGGKQGNWNKTAAQNVVNLDVTKASALWQFYSDIGWYEKSLFDEHVNADVV